MNEVTVRFVSKRNPFDARFLTRLDKIAEEFDASIAEESREAILNEQPPEDKASKLEEFIRWSEENRKRIGPQKTDSVDLIREERDR